MVFLYELRYSCEFCVWSNGTQRGVKRGRFRRNFILSGLESMYLGRIETNTSKTKSLVERETDVVHLVSFGEVKCGAQHISDNVPRPCLEKNGFCKVFVSIFFCLFLYPSLWLLRLIYLGYWLGIVFRQTGIIRDQIKIWGLRVWRYFWLERRSQNYLALKITLKNDSTPHCPVCSTTEDLSSNDGALRLI